jgi:hypothetical protein
MTKYRIIEDASGFYAQERKTIFHFWRWLDKNNPCCCWLLSRLGQEWSRCASLEVAKSVIEKRIDYLKHQRQFPITHKYKA